MIEIECELKYYEVEDPHRRAISYYKDEYLSFLEVTPDGIVAQWNWDVHFENDNWYKGEILPAFKRHIDRFLGRMSTLQGALSCLEAKVLTLFLNLLSVASEKRHLSEHGKMSHGRLAWSKTIGTLNIVCYDTY
jgi:hypothetical protein